MRFEVFYPFKFRTLSPELFSVQLYWPKPVSVRSSVRTWPVGVDWTLSCVVLPTPAAQGEQDKTYYGVKGALIQIRPDQVLGISRPVWHETLPEIVKPPSGTL